MIRSRIVMVLIGVGMVLLYGHRHPPEVVRILKLLPTLPENATAQEVQALLPPHAQLVGRSVHVSCCYPQIYEAWEIAPGYQFHLFSGVDIAEHPPTARMYQAGFSGPPPPVVFWSGEGFWIYPYRNHKGMVYWATRP
jgi:hypothetical protein